MLSLILGIVQVPNLFAEESVEDNATVEPYENSDGDYVIKHLESNIEIVYDDSDGSSISDAIILYVPIYNGTQDDNFLHSSPATKIPNVSSDDISTTGSISIKLKLKNSSGVTKQLVAAVSKGDTNNWVMQSISENFLLANDSTVDEMAISFSASQLCENIDCSSLRNTSMSVEDTSHFIYLYMENDEFSYGNGQPVTSSDFTSGGVYFRFYLSNKITDLTGVEKAVEIETIVPGDSRLTLHYKGELINNFDQTCVFKDNNSDTPVECYNKLTSSGAISFYPLVNENEYSFEIVFANKYGFRTDLSGAWATGTPQEIEPFLEKSACFLLSAGFKREHYVVTFFKSFRDNTLMHSETGRSIISIYYKYASKWAMTVYESEFLSKIMRWSGYTLYFIFNFFTIIIILLVVTTISIIGIYILKRVQYYGRSQ